MNTTQRQKSRLKFWVIIPVALFVSGCGSLQESMRPIRNQTNAYEQVKPKSEPRKTLTSFTDALECMDSMLASHPHAKEILISLSPVEETLDTITGMKDMLMTSLSTMSLNNNLVKVVTNIPDDNPFYAHATNQNFRAPDLFIQMSAPQTEHKVQASNNSGSLDLPLSALNTRLNRTKNASIISIDMNMGKIDTLQLVPGVFSRNSITVLSSSSNGSLAVGNPAVGSAGYSDGNNTDPYSGDEGYGYDLGEEQGFIGQDPNMSIGKITKFGTHFQVDFSYQEGRHTAVRTLIELGIIELLGKYYDLPYWECLVDSSTDIKPSPVDRITSTTVNDNIEYSKPTNNNLALAPLSAIRLTLKAKGSSKPVVYSRGDSIELELSTSADAHVFCYYQTFSDEIYQIFPTPYDRTSQVLANNTIGLPADSRLKIVADSPGPDESIQCVAHSLAKINDLPITLLNTSFASLAYKSVTELIEQHRMSNQRLVVSPKFVLSLE